MSAKRSWDVRREVRSAPVESASVAPSRRRESLKERRKKQRKVALIILGVIGLLLLIGLIYLLWQPFVRISVVEAEGPSAEAVRALSEEALQGTYIGILPRNSIFIFPESRIRARVLEAHPSIAAVSISRTSFTSISVKGVSRTSAFVWCGPSVDRAERCHDADAEGLIFAEAAHAPQEEGVVLAFSASSTDEMLPVPEAKLVDTSALRIYAPLQDDLSEDGSPVRAYVIGASRIPDALRFVKAMSILNVGIASIEIRDDEADLYTTEGTRITYILGNEEEAAALAASSFPTLNVQNGHLIYVDLRFEGKVYIKRHTDPGA